MRKRTLVAVALMLGLVLLLILRSRETEMSVASSLSGATTARASGSPTPGPPGAMGPPERPVDLVVPGTPEGEAEGFLEVEVLAGERPVPSASVRLYERGARDPNLGEVVWRQVASGSTDARGRVRLPSGPGNYLVAVHAAGMAPLLREVV